MKLYNSAKHNYIAILLPVTYRQVNIAVPAFGQNQIEGIASVVEKRTSLVQHQSPRDHLHHTKLDVDHIGHPIRMADFQWIANSLDFHCVHAK